MKKNNFKYEYIEYKNFRRCLKISTSNYTVILATQFGPRILFFGPNDKFNMLFEDTKDVFTMSTKEHQKKFHNKIWHCYGGHRLWVSPESILTYAPDNKPLNVQIRSNKIMIKAPTLPLINLKICWVLNVEQHKLNIKHSIQNLAKQSITLAPWSLTQMAPNGIAIFKFNDNQTGFLPNRRLIVWPYTHLQDARLFLGNKYLSLKMDPTKKQALKLGMDYHIGKASYILNNYQFTIQFKHNMKGDYPDYGCSLEAYTNNHFLEIETLGTLINLQSQASVRHKETWTIRKIKFTLLNTDEKINKLF
ncbi:MAG: hypothetical protein LBF00_02745 [Mycoplasmataceae bacterium]|nr:hypothetical protein [Mycoplasmataceae bacterium]